MSNLVSIGRFHSSLSLSALSSLPTHSVLSHPRHLVDHYSQIERDKSGRRRRRYSGLSHDKIGRHLEPCYLRYFPAFLSAMSSFPPLGSKERAKKN